MQYLPLLAFETYSTIELAAGAFATLSVLLGLFISYQAYRGLRRNDSKRMRYLSLGMILLFGVTYAVAFAGQSLITARALPLVYRDLFRLLVRVLQFVGLALITYSLWLAPRSGRGAHESR